MGKGILGSSIVTQIGFIVRDCDASKKKFAEFLGLEEPPSFWTDGIEKSQSVYRGQPCPAKAKLAFLKVGETLDIELIEPDGQPSVWQEFLDEKGEGIQHIAFQIKDTKGKLHALGEAGMPTLQTGEYTGGRYSYVDAMKELNVVIELLEND